MRGESTRVAARVRHLLTEHSGDPDDVPSPVPGWRERLAARVPVRLDPGRRAAAAVGLAVLVAALLTGLWVSAERPRALAVATAAPTIAGATSPAGTGAVPAPDVPASASRSAAASPAVVVVDVAGKVRHPGLYRLAVGARIDDAVRAAGGALAGVDLSSLNLAAKVVDGQQIPVGVQAAVAVPGADPAAPDGSDVTGGPGGASTPVDLNAATIDQLQTLPGVGPVLAQHILDWRTAHGRFATVSQLDDVPGIGDVKFAALKALVTV